MWPRMRHVTSAQSLGSPLSGLGAATARLCEKRHFSWLRLGVTRRECELCAADSGRNSHHDDHDAHWHWLVYPLAALHDLLLLARLSLLDALDFQGANATAGSCTHENTLTLQMRPSESASVSSAWLTVALTGTTSTHCTCGKNRSCARVFADVLNFMSAHRPLVALARGTPPGFDACCSAPEIPRGVPKALPLAGLLAQKATRRRCNASFKQLLREQPRRWHLQHCCQWQRGTATCTKCGEAEVKAYSLSSTRRLVFAAG